MSNQEINKFDPADAMKNIKDRIKSSFVELIPDEQWNEMVASEIKSFFYKKSDYSYHRESKSDFEVLVRNEITKESIKRMAEYFSSQEFNEMWQLNGNNILSQKVKDLLIENSGIILANMLGVEFSNMLNNFAQGLRSRALNY